jgi:hypothetical protein
MAATVIYLNPGTKNASQIVEFSRSQNEVVFIRDDSYPGGGSEIIF